MTDAARVPAGQSSTDGPAGPLPGVHLDGGPRLSPRRDPAAYLEACADRYGDVFALTPQHIQVWDPAGARDVLRREDDFALAPAAVRTSRTSVQVDSSDRWHHARRYAWDHLATSPGRAPEIAARWAGALPTARRLTASTQVVDLTARVVWPELLDDIGRGEADHLADTLSRTSHARQHSKGFRSPWWERRLRRQFDEVIEGLMSLVARRRHEEPRGDLLDALLAGDAPPLDDLEVAQTMAIALDSGMQTTGAAVAWVLTTVGGMTSDDQAACEDHRTAEHVIKEILRHTPVIAGLNRTSSRDATVGGCPAPQGTELVVAVEGMHRRASLWSEDPTVFDPTRWARPRPHTRGAYLPYGAGPRVCLGMHLANTVLGELVTLLGRWYEVDASASPRPRRDNLCWPRGYPVTITPRVSA